MSAPPPRATPPQSLLTTMNRLDPFLPRVHIAYFTMEIALRPEMHTYSGGLGVLAGDTARSCADLDLPIVFVSLISRQGYLRQVIDDAGRQVNFPDPWEPSAWASPLDAMIAVTIEGRDVWIRPWLFSLACPLGHCVPVLLLDTDLEQNSVEDRHITDSLYGGDARYRFRQEVVLGIGGARMLQALGFGIRTYHLNEGHAALLPVELLRRFRRPAEDVAQGESALDHARVRQQCIFTTHTPVEAGHDRFPYDLVTQVLGDYIDLDELRALGGRDELNLTRLALNLSGYINGVAPRHAETTRRTFPGYLVHAVANGVHVPTWAHAAFARLFQARFPQWAHDPAILVLADQLPDEDVWNAHRAAKEELLTLVRDQAGVAMSADVPVIGFARRMTGYKRPELLFHDIDRLVAIARQHPFQVVFAGKAHPRDDQGRQLIEQINGHIRRLSNDIPMAFLADYDMAKAATLVSGSDIWLNTPLPPLEASGTSGMKAAVNGVINLSVLDGWWTEACIEGVTGWAIGDGLEFGPGATHAEDLYHKLADVVLPMYYSDRGRWIWMMKQNISKIACYFNSQRMMRRYASEAYLR
jgi:starch phosphorylase